MHITFYWYEIPFESIRLNTQKNAVQRVIYENKLFFKAHNVIERVDELINGIEWFDNWSRITKSQAEMNIINKKCPYKPEWGQHLIKFLKLTPFKICFKFELFSKTKKNWQKLNKYVIDKVKKNRLIFKQKPIKSCGVCGH